MTDTTDDLEGYEDEDDREDEIKNLIAKYQRYKDELVQLYSYGESSTFTLQEIIQLTKHLHNWEI